MGGVLLASLLIRHPHYLDKVRSNVCFGTKRSIYRRSFEKWFKVNLVWNRFAPMMAKRHGFFDAKRLGIGADSESKMSLDECIAWVNKGSWIDPRDGFDYGSAAEHTRWPPTWHLTGIKDLVLGYRGDVQRFIDECRNENAKFSLLSKQNGNMVDYDHNDILTHRLAVDDHFPMLLNWLKQH
ncbi:hypothetical protein [Thalassotalea sp. Y01]|uniref:hypothetical protein n=1 Tax=Thalassotalea sp. Y01 TaxID=2729613 RepID=UPI001B7D4DFD|nr:hypothetical protein [Thalassotalea sp. Y01]